MRCHSDFKPSELWLHWPPELAGGLVDHGAAVAAQNHRPADTHRIELDAVTGCNL
jgi:hypothetical protein